MRDTPDQERKPRKAPDLPEAHDEEAYDDDAIYRPIERKKTNTRYGGPVSRDADNAQMPRPSSKAFPWKQALITGVLLVVCGIAVAVAMQLLVGISGRPSAANPTTIPEALHAQATSAFVLPVVTPAPSPTPSPSPPPLMKNGSTGEDVLRLQERLIALGYLSGEADGVFGKATGQAVQAFQAQHGLDADGLAGQQTTLVLFSDAATPYREGGAGPSETVLPLVTILP